jgi:hypothetical protein
MTPVPTLAISPEKVCFLAAKARAFDVRDVVTGPYPATNPVDDGMLAVLEEHADDATQQELTAFINALTEDEQADLVALTWLGRGEATIDEWDELRVEAARACNKRTAQYLLGTPLLADYLDEGLTQFGHACA